MHLVSLNLFSFLGQGFVVFILSFTFVLFLQIVTGFQFSLVAQLCLTLCDPMDCSTPAFPVHHQLLEPTQPHVHRVGNAIQPSHPLSSPLFLPSIFPSMRVFSDESALHIRWPKYWSFSFNIGVSVPSNEHPGLISFRMDWLGLLLQHHSSKASILLL